MDISQKYYAKRKKNRQKRLYGIYYYFLFIYFYLQYILKNKAVRTEIRAVVARDREQGKG